MTAFYTILIVAAVYYAIGVVVGAQKINPRVGAVGFVARLLLFGLLWVPVLIIGIYIHPYKPQ